MFVAAMDEAMTEPKPILSHPYFAPQTVPRNVQVLSNWHTLDDQSLSMQSIKQLLSNSIPTIRRRNFLSEDECQRLVEIIQTHEIGTYNQEVVFPPVGTVGITQFDYQRNKEGYFDGVTAANSLQERFKREAGIDVLARVAKALREVTGLPVRIAKEDEREYFAGLLRVVGDNTVQIHPDYAPYDGPEWEIGRIIAQLTWNVLLKQVPGGDTIIYDRQWQGAADEIVFRKRFPSYAYSPSGLEGRIFKVMPAVEGDLTLFNPRNFHEVKACDKALGADSDDIRYTISSFIGLLPETARGGQALILWS